MAKEKKMWGKKKNMPYCSQGQDLSGLMLNFNTMNYFFLPSKGTVILSPPPFFFLHMYLEIHTDNGGFAMNAYVMGRCT
jgi:hypothetical protein